MTDFLEIVDEVISEEMEIMEELIQEEIMPLIKYREVMEKKIANKAISEMYKLEQEA